MFAKTDMIHAQQKGYTTEQILRGLCDAVARNFKSSIVKGRAVVAPVAFIGGVAMNAGISNALGEAFKLGENDTRGSRTLRLAGGGGRSHAGGGRMAETLLQAHPSTPAA